MGIPAVRGCSRSNTRVRGSGRGAFTRTGSPASRLLALDPPLLFGEPIAARSVAGPAASVNVGPSGARIGRRPAAAASIIQALQRGREGCGLRSEIHHRVGIDIGGTFTDIVLLADATGERAVGKVLTTPDDPSEAVEEGLVELLEREEVAADQLKTIIHGTSLVTNALIERKGARTALLTTEGFRDAVAIGTEHRYDMDDIFIEKPEPLVERSLRYGVCERVLDDGSVLLGLDEEQVRQVAAELREREVRAVAVSFLHSFRNPAHEQRVAELIAEEAPEIMVSLSCEVAPEIREYERTSTTIDNVYVRPLVVRYLRGLEERLARLGFEGSLYIMLSNGGTASVETAREFPIRLLESGPAAGALAAAFYGGATGFSEVLSFDMGVTP